MYFKTLIFCVGVVSVFDSCNGSKKAVDKRKLTSYANYGCNATRFPQCEDGSVNLMYTKAEAVQDSKDVLHYVWSTIGGPAVLVARTFAKAELKIDWVHLLSKNTSDFWNSVYISGYTPKDDFVYGFEFRRLLEYNDADDKSDMSKINATDFTQWRIRELDHVAWNWTDRMQVDNHQAHFVYTEIGVNGTGNGTVTFTVEVTGEEGRGSRLPFMDLTENTTSVQFEVDGVPAAFKSSRFALEMSLVASVGLVGDMDIEKSHSIDDEYSPGAFRLLNWRTGAGNHLMRSYASWKPVVYNDPDWSLETTTRTREYGLVKGHEARGQRDSVVYAFFGNDSSIPVSATNVSFGLTKDKFYNKNNYTAWTINIGYGDPPQDSVSSLILILVIVGLGSPVLLIMVGGLFVCIKRRRAQSSGDGYEPIN